VSLAVLATERFFVSLRPRTSDQSELCGERALLRITKFVGVARLKGDTCYAATLSLSERMRRLTPAPLFFVGDTRAQHRCFLTPVHEGTLGSELEATPDYVT
jgi:hypothetical protein